MKCSSSASSVAGVPGQVDDHPKIQSLLAHDSFAARTLKASEHLPTLTWTNWHTQVVWFNLIVIVTTPTISLYGAFTTKLSTATFAFCVFYYVFNMIGTQWRLVDIFGSQLILCMQESPRVCQLKKRLFHY